jgi:hypothetical protein
MITSILNLLPLLPIVQIRPVQALLLPPVVASTAEPVLFAPYSRYRHLGQDVPPGSRVLDFQLERDVDNCWDAAIERNLGAGLATELKTLVYRVGSEYWCFNLPADRRLPLRRWNVPGLNMVRFPESHELKAGCINPFRVACRLPLLRMFFDHTLSRYSEYYTNDGTRRGTLAIPIGVLSSAFRDYYTFTSVN